MSDQKIPEGWRETSLEEVVTFNYGKSLTSTNRIEGNIPVYGSSGVTGWHNEALVKPNGLIIGRKGTVGSIYKSEVPFYPIDTVYYVTESDTSLDFNFLLYLLQSLGLESMNSDSAIPGLNRNRAYSIKLKIPKEKDEQKAIAAVLSSLDDKIELLHEQNKKLENIAQTIFKEWFGKYQVGDDLPEGWRVGKLKDLNGEITDFVANGSFASLKENVTLYSEPNYALFLRNTDLKSNFTQKVYVDKHSYDFLKKTQMFGGEIIISNVGDVGSVYLCPFLETPMVLGNNTICLKSKHQYYLYTLFRHRIGQFLIESITGGSAQPKFNKTDFRNLDLIIPQIKILENFNNLAEPIYKKILSNQQTIDGISKTRDTLLPKLMKGEVRVKV